MGAPPSKKYIKIPIHTWTRSLDDQVVIVIKMQRYEVRWGWTDSLIAGALALFSQKNNLLLLKADRTGS